MGVSATQMERKGIVTARGEMNRDISPRNQRLFTVLAKLKGLKDLLKKAIMPAAPPTFASVLQDILENKQGKIRNPETAARVLAFMQENGISKLSELREVLAEIHKPYDAARDNLKYYDQRIKRLDEHIRQGTVYLKNKELYTEYKNLKPKKQPKFFEEHRAPLMLFEAAQRYFDEQRIRPGFSVGAWKEEQEKATAERGKAYREYAEHKDRVYQADTVFLDAEKIVRALNRTRQRDEREMGSVRFPVRGHANVHGP